MNNNPFVKIDKGQLWVLSADNVTYTPYFIKGAGYEPTPIGRYPSDWGYTPSDPRSANNNIYDDPDILNRDFSLLKNMNANTVRIWKGNNTKISCPCWENGRHTSYITNSSNTINANRSLNTMDLANQYGIKVIAGFWVDYISFDANNNIYNKQQFIDDFVRFVNTFKNDRSILFWAIGNENNYQVLNASGPVPRSAFNNVFGLSYGDAIYDWLRSVGNFLNFNGGIIVDLTSNDYVNILKNQYPADYLSILNILRQYSGQRFTPQQLKSWYSLVDQMAYAAHLAEDPTYKSDGTGGKRYHPVALVNGGINEIGNSNNGTTDAQLPNLDIWGSNVYTGRSFGTLFVDYAIKSKKPLWIAEFGLDAWMVTSSVGINNWGNSLNLDLGGTGYFDLTTQSIWDVALWKEILSNSPLTIGGTVMEYSDEYWKPYEFYCSSPSNGDYYNRISTSICNSNQKRYGFPFLNNPDGFSNENIYGIMSIQTNPTIGGADLMIPRQVYNDLKLEWLSNPWISLNLNITGTGSGVFSSTSALGANLSCSFTSGTSQGVCSGLFTKNKQATLSFTSSNNSKVSNWGVSGCTSGSSTCNITTNVNTTVSITIDLNTTPSTPVITSQPINKTVTMPTAASFAVTATGTPTPTYQWKQMLPNTTTFVNIPGATARTYSIAATALSNSGTKYQCVVTNSVGSVTSNAATLTVNPQIAPVITTQPINQTVTAPGAATFTVTATGTPTPTYQWKQMLPNTTTYTNIAGATSRIYTTTATTIANNGTKYQCVVTNSAGSVTSTTAILTVNAPTLPSVSFSTPSNNATYFSPANITMTAVASNFGSNLKSLSLYGAGVLLNSCSTSSCSAIFANQLPGQYTLRATATDMNNVSTSTSINVIVNQPAPTNVTLFLNPISTIAPGQFVLGVNYSASAPITKIEYYNGTLLLGTTTATNPFFTWNNVAAGVYSVTVKVYDNAGNVTTSVPVSITVTGSSLPSVSFSIPSNGAVYTAPANVSITASATTPNSSLKTLNLYNGGVLLTSCTLSPCSANLTNLAAGQYTLAAQVTDMNNISASSSISVTVNQPTSSAVTLFYNPISTKAPGQFVFGANYTVPGPISKIEYYNGTTFLGSATAANPFFAWNNVPAGVYSIIVKVYDSVGGVFSSVPVILTVTSS